MQTRFFHRAVSLSLAAVVTLAMLGSIDQLSAHEATTAVWAQAQQAAQPA